MIRVRRLFSAIALCSVLAVAAAGCHKKVPPPAPQPPPTTPTTAPATPPPPPPPPPPPAPASAPRPLTEEEIFARKSVDQLNAERPLDDVYFDLDKSEIRDDARASLQTVLRQNTPQAYWDGAVRLLLGEEPEVLT